MKRTLLVIAAALAAGSMYGCGGGDGEKKTSSAAPATSGVSQADAAQASAITTTDPKDAVGQFLNALRDGDEKTAEALLTEKAREETARHNMAVQPPGTPNARYQIGRVEHPEGQENAAYVSCLWTEKHTDNEEETYEVVWVLRNESLGWRIAGIAMDLAEDGQPIFLNFENPAEMLRIVGNVESQTGAAQQAQNATGTEVR